MNRNGAPLIGGYLSTGINQSTRNDDQKLFGNKLNDSFSLPFSQKNIEAAEETIKSSSLVEATDRPPRNANSENTIPKHQDKSRTVVYRHTSNPGTIKSKKSSIQTRSSNKISNYDIAYLLMEKHKFAVIRKILYYWNPLLGHYIGLVGDQADNFIRQNTPDDLKEYITTRNSDEIVRWLIANEQLEADEKALTKRKAYVPFTNCVVRFSDLTILHHSPDFYFTSVVNASYPIDKYPSGKNFEKFIHWITGDNQALYWRLQELFGYILSEVRDVKILPFLLGPKDSGKSIVLKLLESMIGEEFTTNLSLEEMNKPEYLANLLGKKLNACGEISEVPLKRLDTLKKLSGGDYVMARFLYANAIKFTNTAALIFACNHLPIIRGGIDRSNAFSQRLRIFPFQYQVPKKYQDIHLLDKLLEEKPYIAKWSLQGLNRWSQNNYQFTTCDEVEELALDYSNNNNSIKSFIVNCCLLDPELRTHNSILFPAYTDYCLEHDFMPESDKSFHRHMQHVERLRHDRFRDDDRNENGYYGIGLREG